MTALRAERLLSEDIIERARQSTGLVDLGTTGFAGRLDAMVESAAAHPGLDAAGFQVLAEELESLVSLRLRFEHDRQTEPAIASQRIERPMIVAGTPRSGTSLLHALLAEDPAGRPPRAWEVMHPSPPPSLASAEDPRRERVAQMLKDWCLVAPGMFVAHPYWDEWADSLMECESLLTLDLHNTYPAWFARTPAIDFGPAHGADAALSGYHWHRAVLQQLQWGGPDRHWVLKGVNHQFALDALLETYPDANVVWIHRHPTQIFASLMELMAVLIEGHSRRAVDRRTIGPQFIERWGNGLMHGLTKPEVDDPRVCHVLYADFITDPAASIRGLYERMGRDFSDEHERRIRAWLASPSNRPNRHGTFHYDLQWFGITPDQLEKRFAEYIERFHIPA